MLSLYARGTRLAHRQDLLDHYHSMNLADTPGICALHFERALEENRLKQILRLPRVWELAGLCLLMLLQVEANDSVLQILQAFLTEEVGKVRVEEVVRVPVEEALRPRVQGSVVLLV